MSPQHEELIVGQKASLKLKDIWALRVRLQMEDRLRELTLLNLGIYSKLRGCDLVKLKVRDRSPRGPAAYQEARSRLERLVADFRHSREPSPKVPVTASVMGAVTFMARSVGQPALANRGIAARGVGSGAATKPLLCRLR